MEEAVEIFFPKLQSSPLCAHSALKGVGEWCPAACRPGEELVGGAGDWAGCKNASGGRGGVGKGGARPL